MRRPRKLPLDPGPDDVLPLPRWLAVTLANLDLDRNRGLIGTAVHSAAERVLSMIEVDPLWPPALHVECYQRVSLTWATVTHTLVVYPFWIRPGMVAARVVLFEGKKPLCDTMMGSPAESIRDALATIFPDVWERGQRPL